MLAFSKRVLLAKPAGAQDSGGLRYGIAAIALAGAVGFLAFPDDLAFLTRLIVAALFVLSLDLVVGYSGVATLGHAVLFGAGAYAAGVSCVQGLTDPMALLIVGACAGALMGVISGSLIVGFSGLPQLVLSIALVQLMNAVANKASWITGGSDGLSGITPAPVLGLFKFDLYGQTAYIFALLVLLATFAVLWKIVRSPFGLLCQGIKEDPIRVFSLGVEVRPALVRMYGISGAVAGLAGALAAITTGVVGLDSKIGKGPPTLAGIPEGRRSLTELLKIEGLHKSFGGLHVNRDINLALNAGDRVALIGPNGAGKTTFINLVTGALSPSSGSIKLNGEDVTRLRMADRVRRGLVRSFQVTRLFRSLRVGDNIALAVLQREGRTRRLFADARQMADCEAEVADLLGLLGIGHLINRQVAEIAYGQQRLLEIALALALRPKVLLLDEPAAGVPQDESPRILEAIERLPPDIAVLIIEHDMDLVFRFARRVAVLAGGELIFEGTPNQVSDDPKVREAYLGSYAYGRGAA
jgi:branched-chain amino acid transport system ATP-binding protein